jgi:demethylmenaquinone methyltransferase/2-methoxy-6-polyprenyl-1,4-benzoquinol methylase
MPRSHFDLLAPFYDRVIRPPDLTHLARLAGLPCAGCLLDAGGGTGRIAGGLADRVARAVVADESIAMLSQARRKMGLRLVAGRTEHLPFRGESFARVVIVDALHHVKDSSRSLAELWRMVEPGGRLIIEEPDILRPAVRLVAFLERLAGMRSRFLRGEEIAVLLAAHGAQARLHRVDHTVWVVAEKGSVPDSPTPST